MRRWSISDHYNASHVNHEGVITSSTSAAVPLGAAGLTTATGAVAGAMIGGGVGAVVGAGVGAGLGAYWWLRTDHQQTLPTGTEIVFSLNDVLTVAPTQADGCVLRVVEWSGVCVGWGVQLRA